MNDLPKTEDEFSGHLLHLNPPNSLCKSVQMQENTNILNQNEKKNALFFPKLCLKIFTTLQVLVCTL